MTCHTAYIAFGSNIGDSKDNIKAAADALALLPGTTLEALSEIYETEPWGYKDQPNFMNACCRIKTTLSPNALLGACLGIEAAMGRIRSIKNGPRVIDLDLLSYDDTEMNTKELVLPHPGMKTREFVTLPLDDILSD